MKVVALYAGFHDGSLRQPGEEFDVADGTKSSWFGPADGVAPKGGKGKGKQEPAKQEPIALSQMGAEPAKSMTEVLAAKQSENLA